MVEQQAQVIEIEGDTLYLKAQVQSACGSCSAKKGCGTSVLSNVVGRKFSRFQAVNNIGAKVGDTVIVGIEEGVLIKGSMMMYLMPLLGMLVSALLAEYMIAVDMEQRDMMITVSAVVGLIAGFSLSRRHFNRHVADQMYTPIVLRKLI
jgi:sigma-E factor negative regulatory protein RseC